jgi:hypothetical protein
MSVKFELRIRALTQSDADRSKCFLPESCEYEMYLDALVDDLRAVPIVAASHRTGNSIDIETHSPLEAMDLRDIIKPHFSNERFVQYRFVSILPKQ